ncbi:MAG: phospholipase D-like domain-containing protein [Lachnospiraceae bacterium]|nr:phospholipase D-like domain-containing protein [Lachnospiraceae bacterium]
MNDRFDRVKDIKDRSMDRGRRGVSHVIFGRTGVLIVCLLAEVLLLFLALHYVAQYIYLFFGTHVVFSFLILLLILNRVEHPAFQLAWASLVLLFPIFGGLLYLYIKLQPGMRILERRMQELDNHTRDLLPQDPAALRELSFENPRMAQLAYYVGEQRGCPVYRGSEVTYFASGEEKYEELKKQLRAAKQFIFLEYFIIAEGVMWDSVQEILEQKVQEGVEVRLMYDGMNELNNLPHDFSRKMKGLGIRCKVFSPVYPVISTSYNNRDHRKIVVIDGQVAFTGGVNLADEYINRKERFGHWKDAAIMVRGEAAQSFTVMFLKMWDVTEKQENIAVYLKKPEAAAGGAFAAGAPEEQPPASEKAMEEQQKEQPLEAAAKTIKEQQKEQPRETIAQVPEEQNEENAGTSGQAQETGFVLPYATNPLQETQTAERVYLEILNSAQRYVHIMTPYLIPDHELLQALLYAARRGVDVKLILPHIPDKKYAFALAHSYYKVLIHAGVRIFEYTPGFVHSKVVVSDDICAVVGAINLDYRSLYLNFECAAFLYEVPQIRDIEADFRRTLIECQLMTDFDIRHDKITRKIAGHVLKLLAPLM